MNKETTKVQKYNECELCGKPVIWGENGCPHISKSAYESGKFGIMMGALPARNCWRHYNCIL